MLTVQIHSGVLPMGVEVDWDHLDAMECRLSLIMQTVEKFLFPIDHPNPVGKLCIQMAGH